MEITTALIIQWSIKGFLLFLLLATGFAYTTLLERKLVAWIQVRKGPNRTGPFGLFQPLADGLKLFMKEDLIPDSADKFLFLLAPVLTMVPAVVILAVIPFGETVQMFGQDVFLGITEDLSVGVLYILSIASIAVYGIVLAGWSSNNKYAMLGGLRSTAQMISYELSLGIAFIGPIMITNMTKIADTTEKFGSMSMMDIIHYQQLPLDWGSWTPAFLTWLPNWNVFNPVLFFGSIVFFIAMLAEVNRAPFDMPEAEQELTAGYHTEYSGMKFALFFMGEYIKMIAVSAIWATLFLGGFDGPGIEDYPGLGPLYLVLKIVLSLSIMIWIRATLPRLRYDRLMAFGWKVLMPTSLVIVFLTALWITLTEGLA